MQLIVSLLTLLGMIFAIYKFFRDPDIRAKNRLDIMGEACRLKHKSLDKCVYGIQDDIKLIKENHLRHIEDRVGGIEGDIKAIRAILEDRRTRQ